MLRPTKYSHPDRTIINLSTLILARLINRGYDSFDNLYKYSKKSVNGGDILFLPSINLLFLFGLISYLAKTDSFEYVGPHETI
ncbi:MAG: hypothetical protein Q8T08_02960 [Ignavibacteria bacterium]|nr:hypothetical protein [Ignavibacteria bacterium]